MNLGSRAGRARFGLFALGVSGALLAGCTSAPGAPTTTAASSHEAPDEPTSLTVSFDGKVLRASWSAPVDEGDSPVKSYRVFAGKRAPVTLPADVTQYEIGGIGPTEVPLIQIAAVSDVGQGKTAMGQADRPRPVIDRSELQQTDGQARLAPESKPKPSVRSAKSDSPSASRVSAWDEPVRTTEPQENALPAVSWTETDAETAESPTVYRSLYFTVDTGADVEIPQPGETQTPSCHEVDFHQGDTVSIHDGKGALVRESVLPACRLEISSAGFGLRVSRMRFVMSHLPVRGPEDWTITIGERKWTANTGDLEEANWAVSISENRLGLPCRPPNPNFPSGAWNLGDIKIPRPDPQITSPECFRSPVG